MLVKVLPYKILHPVHKLYLSLVRHVLRRHLKTKQKDSLVWYITALNYLVQYIIFSVHSLSLNYYLICLSIILSYSTYCFTMHVIIIACRYASVSLITIILFPLQLTCFSHQYFIFLCWQHSLTALHIVCRYNATESAIIWL